MRDAGNTISMVWRMASPRNLQILAAFCYAADESLLFLLRHLCNGIDCSCMCLHRVDPGV